MKTRVPTLTDGEERILDFIWSNPGISSTSVDHWFACRSELAPGTINNYILALCKRGLIRFESKVSNSDRLRRVFDITPYGLSVLKNWRRYSKAVTAAREKMEAKEAAKATGKKRSK